jgi:hypothetical protein
MKPEKKDNALLKKLTLADARKRIEEFRHLTPVEGKAGSAPAPSHDSTKRSAGTGKK